MIYVFFVNLYDLNWFMFTVGCVLARVCKWKVILRIWLIMFFNFHLLRQDSLITIGFLISTFEDSIYEIEFTHRKRRQYMTYFFEHINGFLYLFISQVGFRHIQSRHDPERGWHFCTLRGFHCFLSDNKSLLIVFISIQKIPITYVPIQKLRMLSYEQLI